MRDVKNCGYGALEDTKNIFSFTCAHSILDTSCTQDNRLCAQHKNIYIIFQDFSGSVARSDDPTENYHPPLQLPLTLCSFVAQLCCLVHSHLSQQCD